ncbi:hypothetical protein CW304_15270 [Bacillus sp. UFRGS-B20]|nr:hypothetical protein CW304_15270 [Bacillus sp. UFRGS-B20]
MCHHYLLVFIVIVSLPSKYIFNKRRITNPHASTIKILDYFPSLPRFRTPHLSGSTLPFFNYLVALFCSFTAIFYNVSPSHITLHKI